MVFLSFISILIIIGHLASIVWNRSFWPFDNYPMYSFPIDQMRYPILSDRKLYMLTLVDQSAGASRDLLYGKAIRHPDLHPISRLDVVLLLVKNGFIDGISKSVNSCNIDHFAWDMKNETNKNIESVLMDILVFIRLNNPKVRTLSVHLLEWDDIWDSNMNPQKPNRRTILKTVNYG